MSEEISVKVHYIPQDGYPDMSNLTGQVAFLWDGNVVNGWPLDGDGGEYEPDLDDDDFLLWAGSSDVARTVEFHGVRYWLEFPEPLWRIVRPEDAAGVRA